MQRCAIVLSMALAMLLVQTAQAQAEPWIVDVDCDAGDDLAQALREIEILAGELGSPDDEGPDVPTGPRPHIVVNISGTCVANVVLNLDEMTLRGVGESPATIQGSENPTGNSSPYGIPVLDARNIQNLHLENLTLSGGWVGLRLAGSLVVLDDCRLTDNGFGMWSENSISVVQNSRFERNRTGITTFGGDHLLLQDSVVADNEQQGVNAFGSAVSIYSGEIRNNRFGLYLGGKATGLLALDVRVDSQVSVIDGSHLLIYGPATIAADGQIFVGNMALFEAYEAGIQADVILARWGRAYFTASPIEGDLVLYDFSEVGLYAGGAELVLCDKTSDVACETGSVGAVMGCEHCDGPVPNGPEPGDAFRPPEAGAIRELLEGLRLPDGVRLDGGAGGGKARAPTRSRAIGGR